MKKVITIILSMVLFLRPDTNAKDVNSLSPDVLVYTKMNDITNNRDAQIEKLKNIIKTE